MDTRGYMAGLIRKPFTNAKGLKRVRKFWITWVQLNWLPICFVLHKLKKNYAAITSKVSTRPIRFIWK
ncbi:hypothetical protein D3C85_1230710 [compost metagenome]